jgi:predicted nucleic acid-binding protein
MINIGEVTYIVGKSAGISKAWQALEYVRSLSLSVLSVSDEAVIAAARNKIEHPISYADAFAVAAARDLGARLVTGDPELLRLEGPVRIEMLSRDSSYD